MRSAHATRRARPFKPPDARRPAGCACCTARPPRSRDNADICLAILQPVVMLNFAFEGVAAIVALALYFLPSIIADRRKRYDLLTIALFNAVVGWTVFGWLLALYWALQPNPPKDVAGEVVKSRKLIGMRNFSKMLGERVQLRGTRNAARERAPKSK
jgi:hypothetical protein